MAIANLCNNCHEAADDTPREAIKNVLTEAELEAYITTIKDADYTFFDTLRDLPIALRRQFSELLLSPFVKWANASTDKEVAEALLELSYVKALLVRSYSMGRQRRGFNTMAISRFLCRRRVIEMIVGNGLSLSRR